MRDAAVVLLGDLASRCAEGQRFRRGRKYQRNQKVTDLVVGPGEAVALVHGSRPEPYEASVATRLAPDHIVDDVIAIASEVGPFASVEHAIERDVDLLPAVREVAFSCTCPDWEEPCKHAVAVMLVLADAVGDDPALLLRWRGIPVEDLPVPPASLPTAPPPAARPPRAPSLPPPVALPPASPAPPVGPPPEPDPPIRPVVSLAVPEDGPDPFFTGDVPESGPLLAGLDELEELPDPFTRVRLVSDGVDAVPVLRDAMDSVRDVLSGFV